MRKFLISTLMCANGDCSVIKETICRLAFPVGIEYFCFQLTDEAEEKFRALHDWHNGDATFHAPMIGTEGTCERGSPEFESLVENYQRCVALCREFSSTEIVFHTNECTILKQEREAKQQNACRNACYLRELCRESGVDLLVETLCLPGKGEPILTDEEYVDFIIKENLRSIVDLGHMNLNGYRLAYVMEKLGKRIKAFHLHNNDGVQDSHRGIFEGTFDYPAFFELYRRFTPEANIVFEYGDTDRTAQDFAGEIAYVKNLCE